MWVFLSSLFSDLVSHLVSRDYNLDTSIITNEAIAVVVLLVLEADYLR